MNDPAPNAAGALQLGFALAPHVRLCETAEGCVLLDLKHNRYYGLPTECLRELGLAASPQGPNANPSCVQGLIDAGLLHRAPPSKEPVRFCAPTLEKPVEAVGAGSRPGEPVSMSDVIRFLRAHSWTRFALRQRSLFEIASIIQAQRPTCPYPVNMNQMTEAIARFRQIRPWVFAAKDRCLLHALTLVRFLALQELHASWVIGVMLRPWGAHSWVQAGAYVLDGDPEQVRPYHPILVV